MEAKFPGGPFQGLGGPRRVWVAFILWLIGGWAGLHRMYLGQPPSCSGCTPWRLGHAIKEWIKDGIHLRATVAQANSPGLSSAHHQAASVRVVEPLSEKTAASFCWNRVSNTKYGSSTLGLLLKFIPLSFAEQLERHTNRYFVFIAVLQLDKGLTPTHPATTWGPLLVILLFTAGRELVDDWARFVMDREANLKEFSAVREGGEMVEVTGESIRVGDLIMVRQDQEVPCDLVLLTASLPDGCCYLETANLDGEADLKLRRALPQTGSLSVHDLHAACAQLSIEVPLLAAHQLKGMLRTRNERGAPAALSEQQALLQGAQLRNAEWAVGVCVYSGNETRLGRSRRPPGAKRSEVDGTIDRISAGVFVCQAVLAGALGWQGNAWAAENQEEAWYLRFDIGQSSRLDSLYHRAVIPLRFLLLMSTMIPLSIQVTMDTCKWLYSLWICWDRGMTPRPPHLKPPGFVEGVWDAAHVRNSDVTENLGQVAVVLTDKTGTLTDNIMVLKALTVAGRVYGCHGEPFSDEVRLEDDQALKSAVLEGSAAMLQLLRCLALCNSVATVAPENVAERVAYEAASPDEEALVLAARGAGVVLLSRTLEKVTVDVAGQHESYTIVRELEFTSERKRMSVVLREDRTGELVLLCKGADESVRHILAPGQEVMDEVTSQHIEDFARSGLRTLLVCHRRVSRQEMDRWEDGVLREALNAGDAREARIAQAYEVLEQGVEILGGTAIEDRLQEGVPQAMGYLREAGIKVWMVTGDKLSTAKQVAISSGLFAGHGGRQSVVCSAPAQVESGIQQLQDNERRLAEGFAAGSPAAGTQELTAVVTGACLAAMTESQKLRLCAACLAADAVVFCRLTPDQKAELVTLIARAAPEHENTLHAESSTPSHRPAWLRRLQLLLPSRLLRWAARRRPPVVMAIGDGANDVAMIQEAHLGVGIVGREGSQAVRASDVSIMAFKDVTRLLLLHGSYSYQRSALIAQLSFFKSWAFCTSQILYAPLSGFGGTSAYDPFAIAACNALLFLPICFYSLNRFIPAAVALQRPSLYQGGARQVHLNRTSVCIWVVRAVYQAALSFALCTLAFDESFITPEGSPASSSLVAVASFAIFLLVQAGNLALETHTFTVPQALSIIVGLIGSLGLYYLCNLSLRAQKLVDLHSFNVAVGNPVFQLLAPLVLVGALAPVVALKFWGEVSGSPADASRGGGGVQVAGPGADEWGGGEGKQLEGSGVRGAVLELFTSPLATPAKDQAARC